MDMTPEDIKGKISERMNVPATALKWGRRGRGARESNYLKLKGSARRLTKRVTAAVPDITHMAENMGLAFDEDGAIWGSMKAYEKLAELMTKDVYPLNGSGVTVRIGSGARMVPATHSEGDSWNLTLTFKRARGRPSGRSKSIAITVTEAQAEVVVKGDRQFTQSERARVAAALYEFSARYGLMDDDSDIQYTTRYSTTDGEK